MSSAPLTDRRTPPGCESSLEGSITGGVRQSRTRGFHGRGRDALPSPTDRRSLDGHGGLQGLTHLFFPPPAERPQARERREATAKAVCASCTVNGMCQRVRPDQPRVRVLGWRERGRAPRGRLPADRPDRSARPRRRLTGSIVGVGCALRSPHDRRRRPSSRRRRGLGRLRRHRDHRRGWTRSAPTSRPTACTACISTTAATLGLQGVVVRLVLPVRRGSRRLSRCASLLDGTRFAGMLADVWMRTAPTRRRSQAHLHLVRPHDVGRVLRRRAPRRCAAAGAQPRPDREPRPRDRRVPPGLHRPRAAHPGGSKTIKSDAIHLLDLLESPFAPRNFDLPPEAIGVLWQHTHEFLERLVELGYDEMAEDPRADRLEPRQLLGRHRTPTAASGCSAGGTTTGSASSRACSTSTSCRGCRAAPATAPGSPTARTRWSSRRSSRSSARIARSSR